MGAVYVVHNWMFNILSINFYFCQLELCFYKTAKTNNFLFDKLNVTSKDTVTSFDAKKWMTSSLRCSNASEILPRPKLFLRPFFKKNDAGHLFI